MSKFNVGDRVKMNDGSGDKGTIVEPTASEIETIKNIFDEYGVVHWVLWDDCGERLWVSEDQIKKIKPKKFAIGAKISTMCNGMLDIGVVCSTPTTWKNNLGVDENDIVWAYWNNESEPTWIEKKYCERYKPPVTVNQEEPEERDAIPEQNINTIEFKDKFVPIKNCFRGAVIRWNGMLGHVVGFVAAMDSDDHDTLYCNFYGNHYNVKCIEAEIL